MASHFSNAPRKVHLLTSNLLGARNAIPFHGGWTLKCRLCSQRKNKWPPVLARRRGCWSEERTKEKFLHDGEHWYSHFVGNIISKRDIPSAKHVRVLFLARDSPSLPGSRLSSRYSGSHAQRWVPEEPQALLRYGRFRQAVSLYVDLVLFMQTWWYRDVYTKRTSICGNNNASRRNFATPRLKSVINRYSLYFCCLEIDHLSCSFLSYDPHRWRNWKLIKSGNLANLSNHIFVIMNFL